MKEEFKVGDKVLVRPDSGFSNTQKNKTKGKVGRVEARDHTNGELHACFGTLGGELILVGRDHEFYRYREALPTSQVRYEDFETALDESKVGSDGSSADYYKIPTSASDLMDLIEHKNMNYAIGNIFKACYRLGEKRGASKEYDLRKIIFFANRELDRLNGGSLKTPSESP